MIESKYWRKDLQQIANFLRLERPYYEDVNSSDSEEKLVRLEKEIMTGFFWCRKLAHSHKLTNRSHSYSVKVIQYPRSKQELTVTNYNLPYELYDFQSGKNKTLSIEKLAHQFIHSHIVYNVLNDDETLLNQVVVCSDFDKDKFIYKISHTEVASAFDVVVNDVPRKFIVHYDSNGGLKFKSS